MSLDKVLDSYRRMSKNEREKGEYFEKLIQRFFKTAPAFADFVEHSWLWSEFPSRSDFGGKDLGIDLVIKTYDGKYWAVQCKFYAEGTRISQDDINAFLANSARSFNDEVTGRTVRFSQRYWIDTKGNWSINASEVAKGQEIPFNRIGYVDLIDSGVDWDELANGEEGAAARKRPKEPRPHQQEAISNAHEHFQNNERGKLVMACGTGKTYTALNIMESETGGNGFALFLVPSIALLSQTLREWMNDRHETIYPVCICSDASSSNVNKKLRRETDTDDISVTDLLFPATTDVDSAIAQLQRQRELQKKKGGIIVIFSTYQSIDVVSKVVHHDCEEGLFGNNDGMEPPFDIIVCDEAHRTAGYTVKGKKESPFVKVHDNSFLPAKRRLYMTATPKLYGQDAKKKAEQGVAVLCSMDDESLFGQEIYRIGFGQAVKLGLLSDYKVMVLTVGEDEIDAVMQMAMRNSDDTMTVDDAAKLIGCINALSKRMMLGDQTSEGLRKSDPGFMHTALAFCSTIATSKSIATVFNNYAGAYYESLNENMRENYVNVSAQHVDGGMGSSERQEKIDWLKEVDNSRDCHILTNVRCLSEGVDVPALDAAIFLSSRKSKIDVVQSVGRVMRISAATGKKFGYIIIPVVVPAGIEPEEALKKSKDFDIVWDVLNALRAHDDRFNAEINSIQLNDGKSNRILVGGTDRGNGDDSEGGKDNDEGTPHQMILLQAEKMQEAIYARMVAKVGTKHYWQTWAKDVAEIARRHTERIEHLISEGGEYKEAFDKFLKGLHKNINPSVTKEDAIDMLAQHIITQPVFDALFEGYDFSKLNPVSNAISNVIAVFDKGMGLVSNDLNQLKGFYDEIHERCEGVNTAEGKQKIITELYENFFKIAAEKTASKLGIVYTPTPVVDFILRSVDAVLAKEFHRHLTDENVHVLDPFTGTGTFIVRLLQLGLIKPEDIMRKYAKELHANEIVLLAYYIASINIESTYHDVSGIDSYEPFKGMCFTDTFQLGEDSQEISWWTEELKANSERVTEQQKAPIQIFVGNPPYSVGQRSANDNAQNESYPQLEKRLAKTYVAGTNATNKNALYDSYIKAFRWASDRLQRNGNNSGGIIGFVSNAGWLDGAAMDGMRACLEKEFSSIYIYNLRGNARTQGEQRRKEKDNVFGQGSRTPVSITILVKNPKAVNEKAEIFYRDIGDYLSREEKFDAINKLGKVTNDNKGWQVLKPNKQHDWLNKRSEVFPNFIPMWPDKKYDESARSFFNLYSMGISSNRDAWVYNFSLNKLDANIKYFIENYNKCLDNYKRGDLKKPDDYRDMDESHISWSSSLTSYFYKRESIDFDEVFETGSYRPFCRTNLYWGANLIHRRSQMGDIFSSDFKNNLIICVSGISGTKDMSALITNHIADLHYNGDSQCFPLYWYEEKTEQQSLFDANNHNYVRHDGITDFVLKEAHAIYGSDITKEDIFFYVYGFLHLPKYREQFAADLKKSLPRIKLVNTRADFVQIMKAGRALANIHLNYEKQPAPEGVVIEGDNPVGDIYSFYSVIKLSYEDKTKKDVINYNNHITIRNVPSKVYDYVVNGRSPVDWIFDRYHVNTDNKSGIENDPNDWSKEHEQPRYILDLLLSVMTVSLKTQEIVNNLPIVNFEE